MSKMKRTDISNLEDLKARRGTDTAYEQLVRERAISNILEEYIRKKDILEEKEAKQKICPEPEFIPCPNCGNPDVVTDVYDYQCDRGVLRFYQRICDECDLAMESSDSQKDADDKWNEMAKKLTKEGDEAALEDEPPYPLRGKPYVDEGDEACEVWLTKGEER